MLASSFIPNITVTNVIIIEIGVGSDHHLDLYWVGEALLERVAL
jgi:hypothetical protein